LKDDKLPSYGPEREAVSAELFNKTFKDLTPTERAAVNKRADTAAASNRQVIVMGEGTPKLEALNPTIAQVRSELRPYSSAYETASGGIKLLDSGSPKAEAQVDRALATLSGDKQLSQAEVMSVVSAGTLPQRVVDSASKFFAGTSGKQSVQEKRDVLEAFAAAAAAKHNTEQAKLGRIYGTSQLSKDQVNALIGEPLKFTAKSVVNKPLTTKTGVSYFIMPDEGQQ
jgi:TPR repeat protein